MNKPTKIKLFLSKHKVLITLVLISALCYGLSFINYSFESIEYETSKVQRRLISRQKTLEQYAKKAITTPVDQWLSLENIPEDMVIYKYNADTLQSWTNLFPISNDEIDIVPWWYIIHDMNTRNYYNTPLAYLGEREQYVNLGSSWYVIKVYKDKGVKVITGLLIKTEYTSENSLLSNSVNTKLGLSNKYAIVPINMDDGNAVFGQNNDPLFSLINNLPLTNIQYNSVFLEWMSLCLLIFALFLYHRSKRNLQSFIITGIGLSFARFVSILISNSLAFTTKIFSPSIYAESNLYNSLGDLLLNHLFVFSLVIALYLSKKNIFKSSLTASPLKIKLIRASLGIALLVLIYYIHITLKSIILNSTLVLELYRIQENTIYSILVYLSYALLFLALLFEIQILLITFRKRSRFSLLKIKGTLIYIFLISIYTISIVAYYSFKREIETNTVITNRLSIERDLSLELQLISVEKEIASDHVISLLLPDRNEMIKYRLSESHLLDLAQKYDIRVTLCGAGDSLNSGNYSSNVDCFDFFNNKLINKFGIPLSPTSSFYYLNNYNSEHNYIGKFSYLKGFRLYNMYLEVNSKPISETIGYPDLLINSNSNNQINIPGIYSYAKYHNDILTSFGGGYNYPFLIDLDLEEGSSIKRIREYLHFFNKIKDESTIIVSRPIRSLTPYLISFSYILLFFSAIILGITRLNSRAKRSKIHLPKRSVSRKIAYLLTTSLVFSLICMGAGSIIFTINLIDESNRLQMEEKLKSVQSTMSEMCKYAQAYTDINTPEMRDAMNMVATNTQVDINLYDPHGRLVRTTKLELFNQSLVSSRINDEAFFSLIHERRRKVIHQESIAGLEYYSLYAPIFNSDGVLITIVNIPYFRNTSQLHGNESSSIIAAIINLYLLLLIAAFFGGSAISNSLTKPLSEISRKMKAMGSSQKAEHINYKARDELGMLVTTYNKMVDDLEESTKQLAKNEREQAWKEMARQIAHEIKNPLTPMRLSIQHLVRMKQQNVPNWEDRFETVSNSLIEQIDILSETATEFSSFAKFYNEEDSSIDLLSLINEQLVLFDNRENISISFVRKLNSATVLAKKSQLARALVNLLSNAIQAVELKKDGKIRITISLYGKFYKIEIEDNGTGVNLENQDKLFKPNFTTKSGGTGLGLAICKSIMDQSQGSISYSSSVLGGANFIVKLPTLESE